MNRTPKIYDVWRIEFEYDDHPGVSKDRPVVIGAIDDLRAVLLLIKVTSHGPRREFPGEVVLRDWREEGLTKPSVARCSKILAVSKEALATCEYLGHLTKADAEEIERALKDIGAIY